MSSSVKDFIKKVFEPAFHASLNVAVIPPPVMLPGDQADWPFIDSANLPRVENSHSYDVVAIEVDHAGRNWICPFHVVRGFVIG